MHPSEMTNNELVIEHRRSGLDWQRAWDAVGWDTDGDDAFFASPEYQALQVAIAKTEAIEDELRFRLGAMAIVPVPLGY